MTRVLEAHHMSNFHTPCCWWPLGHIRGWKGPSGFGAKSSWRDVVDDLAPTDVRKTIVVTGGSRGLGAETVRAFASVGATIVIGARDETHAKSFACELMSNTRAIVHVVELDLRSYESIVAFVRAVARLHLGDVNVLVNNAGVMPCAYDAARGQDPAWHVNFLGHFILTQKLLPHMARGARVCNVTSEVYRFSYDSRDLPLDDVDDPTKYDAVKSYGQSKLAIVLWTCHQARSPALVERDVSMMLVHPGSVETNGAAEARRQSGWRGAVLHCIGAPFVKSLECGAATTVYAALHPSAAAYAEFGHRYFASCNPRETTKQARDRDLARRVTERAAEYLATLNAADEH